MTTSSAIERDSAETVESPHTWQDGCTPEDTMPARLVCCAWPTIWRPAGSRRFFWPLA